MLRLAGAWRAGSALTPRRAGGGGDAGGGDGRGGGDGSSRSEGDGWEGFLCRPLPQAGAPVEAPGRETGAAGLQDL